MKTQFPAYEKAKSKYTFFWEPWTKTEKNEAGKEVKSIHTFHTHIPKHIYIPFWDRRIDNKLFYIIYWIFRFLLVSIWFYFIPFVAIIANFIVPALILKAQEAGGEISFDDVTDIVGGTTSTVGNTE